MTIISLLNNLISVKTTITLLKLGHRIGLPHKSGWYILNLEIIVKLNLI